MSLDPATGEVLDRRYRLAERVGEGGMARVYRAEDLHLQRTVAVKVMRGATELGSIERARSETRLLASLNHHGLVTLYDACLSEEEVSYLVMQFVDGITLRDLIARGPLDPILAATITADLAEALHVAHAEGIVHRDIKPSNVLLAASPVPGAGWRPKLADFGIAHMRDSARVTTPGLMVGTVAYLAPEQAEGAPPAPPADVYSLGIMLIEALSGARPFPQAEGIGTLLARLSTPPPIPETLPEQWRQLLRGMTAHRPDDRPTALEVATTASKTAGGPDAAAAASVVGLSTAAIDVPTAASGAPIAFVATQAAPVEPPAVDGVTERTAVLPPQPPSPQHLSAPGAEAPDGGRHAAGRRVAVGAVVAIGALLAATAVLFGVWSGTATAEPAPSVTPTPSVAATPSPTATEDATESADTSGEADTGSTSGTGGSSDGGETGNGNGNGGSNPNSGPGNNNSGGNGNGNGNG
ncbi:hypothetical protein GCM10017607_04830 [Microbacterium thalassium]|nr:hypothetical protein GCM10017607_04830 [Microbacterium thalassium]